MTDSINLIHYLELMVRSLKSQGHCGSTGHDFRHRCPTASLLHQSIN